MYVAVLQVIGRKRGDYLAAEIVAMNALSQQAPYLKIHTNPFAYDFKLYGTLVNQKNGVSAVGLQKALGLGSYHTAWEWLHKLRRAMVRPHRDCLSGLVEMDETFIGGI